MKPNVSINLSGDTGTPDPLDRPAINRALLCEPAPEDVTPDGWLVYARTDQFPHGAWVRDNRLVARGEDGCYRIVTRATGAIEPGHATLTEACEAAIPPKSPALVEATWRDFADAGLFWWLNRTLHLFGWALVREENPDGTIGRVYPAHCRFRGFAEEDEATGFQKLTQHLHDNAAELVAHTKE